MADAGSPPEGEKKFKRGRRKAVSAAVTELEEGWEPKVFPKSEEESERISNVMDNNILFKHLDTNQRKVILDAMFRVDKKPEDVVIRQGEEGDNFYVIDSGVAEIFVNQKEGDPLHVLTCKDGDSFGELALMYDAPRAATVICKTDMKLWAMDRLTYKHILMDTTMNKRNLYKEFLEHVPLLNSLHPQLQTFKLLVQQTPQLLPALMIQAFGDFPEILEIIEENQDDFLQLLSEPIGFTSIGNSSAPFGDASGYQKATQLLEKLKSTFAEVPGAGYSKKIALRITQGPTNACINWHCDGGYASATVQIALNDPAQYAGGKLCYFVNDIIHMVDRPAGSMTQHPAKVLHAVTSLTEGTRKGLFVVDQSNGLGEGNVLVVNEAQVNEFIELMSVSDIKGDANLEDEENQKGGKESEEKEESEEKPGCEESEEKKEKKEKKKRKRTDEEKPTRRQPKRGKKKQE